MLPYDGRPRHITSISNFVAYFGFLFCRAFVNLYLLKAMVFRNVSRLSDGLKEFTALTMLYSCTLLKEYGENISLNEW